MLSLLTTLVRKQGKGKGEGKVHLHVYSAASRICRLSGAVRHRQGRRSLYRPPKPELSRTLAIQSYSRM